MTDSVEQATLTWRKIPIPKSSFNDVVPRTLRNDAVLSFSLTTSTRCKFATVSMAEPKFDRKFSPTLTQLVQRPLALLALVPKDAALFLAGAFAGAAAKSFTAPLDRVKLLMQVRYRVVSVFCYRRFVFECWVKTTLRICVADVWCPSWTGKCEEDDWFYWGMECNRKNFFCCLFSWF